MGIGAADRAVGRIALGPDAFGLASDLVGNSRGHRVAELMSLERDGITSAFGNSVVRHGGSLDFLVLPDVQNATLLDQDPASRAVMDAHKVSYLAGYMHSKAMQGVDEHGRPVGMMSGVNPRSHSLGRDDGTVEVRDELAEATGDVIRSSLAHPTGSAPRTAIDAAAALGALWDDPQTGARLLTEGKLDMLHNARTSWEDNTKGLEESDYLDAVVAAHRRGVRIGIATREIADAAREVLADHGIPVAVFGSADRRSRVDVAIADGEVPKLARALFETGYGLPVMELHSRNSGVLVQGDAAQRVRAQFVTTGGGVIANYLRETGTTHGALPRGAVSIYDARSGTQGFVPHVH